MVDDLTAEQKELMIYRKLCEIGLSGGPKERKDAIKILEGMKTIQAVDVLLTIFLHHPEGKLAADFDLPRSEAVMPLLRLWKIAPEKIIPFLPNFLGYIRESMYINTNDLPMVLGEIGDERLQEVFIKGLNAFDPCTRAGVLYCLADYHIIENNLLLLTEAYKIESCSYVQEEIECQLLANLKEELVDVFFDLIKNFRLEANEHPYCFDSLEINITDEMNERLLPLLLKRWKREDNEAVREYILFVVENLFYNYEGDIYKILNKDDLKQLQETGILKK